MAKREPFETPEDQIPSRLKEASRRSGKPLEVVCGRSFLQSPSIPYKHDAKREEWKVYLNSYYHDGISDKMRELDVLARRQRFVPIGDGGAGFNSMLETFVSCKGFGQDEHLLTFSVRRIVDVNPEDPPIIPVQFSRPKSASTIGRNAVDILLYSMCGMNSEKTYDVRRTVGFDLVKDPEEAGKEWVPKGDRTFFDGLDSGLRASFFWRSIQLPKFNSMNEGLLRVQVSVMVFLRPWSEIAIDNGQLADPVKRDLSFTANLYPEKGATDPPASLFTLLISRERLPDLQKALADLYCRMWDWGADAYKNPL